MSAKAVLLKISDACRWVVPRLKAVRVAPKWRLCLALLWELLGLAILAPLYLLITAEGMRYCNARFAMRWSRAPFLHWMKSYEGWCKLDLAHVGSLALLGAVFYTWLHILRELLLQQGNADQHWKSDNTRVFWIIAGSALLSADGIFIFFGLASNTWSSGLEYFGSFVLSVAFVSVVVVFVKYSVVLWHKRERSLQ